MAPVRRKPAAQPTPAKRRKNAAANDAAPSVDDATTENTESMDLGDDDMEDPDEDLLNMPIPDPPEPCRRVMESAKCKPVFQA